MAAAIENRTADAHWSKPGRIASIELVHDLGSAEAIWRGLENAKQSCTPYQRFDFVARLAAPCRRARGPHPLHRDRLRRRPPAADAAAARAQACLRRALRELHGRQAFDLQHGAVGQGFCRDRDARRSRRPDRGVSERHEADVLALHQQPLRWRDLPNPIALLPHQPSANDCPLLTMEPGAAPATLVSNSFRRRLKGKERKLQPLARLSLSRRH